MLRSVWRDHAPQGLLPVWQTRRSTGQPDELVWDILHDPVPKTLPQGAVILHLAGSTARQAAAYAEHAPLARAIARAAADLGAIHILHASSAAVYGIGEGDHREDETTNPPHPYGMAKVEAEQAFAGPVPVTRLRIGNIAGADALLGNPAARLMIDPIPRQNGGPERSYIGPVVLAQVLGRLAQMVAAGANLPDVLNVVQVPAVAMADLAVAAGRDWGWGPENPQAIARVALSADRLALLVPEIPAASARGLVADLSSLKGVWP